MVHLFRHPKTDQWVLANKPLNPARSGGVACIAAAGGPVPTGARAWRVAERGKWVDAEVTAREVAYM
jgi:hypothetical protein